jgi:hypothetical protein
MRRSSIRAPATYKFSARSKQRYSWRWGGEVVAICCLSVQKTALCVGNALTAIPRFIYARLHDQKNPYSLLYNRVCQHLRCTGSVAHSRRIARRGADETAHAQEGENDGITSRGCCLGFACCVARHFTKSQARSQKSGGWHGSESGRLSFTGRIARRCAQSKRYSQKSGDSNESFTITCQILAWRPVQAKKFCGSESGRRDRGRREEQKRRGSSQSPCTRRRARSGVGEHGDTCLSQGRITFLRHNQEGQVHDRGRCDQRRKQGRRKGTINLGNQPNPVQFRVRPGVAAVRATPCCLR